MFNLIFNLLIAFGFGVSPSGQKIGELPFFRNFAVVGYRKRLHIIFIIIPTVVSVASIHRLHFSCHLPLSSKLLLFLCRYRLRLSISMFDVFHRNRNRFRWPPLCFLFIVSFFGLSRLSLFYHQQRCLETAMVAVNNFLFGYRCSRLRLSVPALHLNRYWNRRPSHLCFLFILFLF